MKRTPCSRASGISRVAVARRSASAAAGSAQMPGADLQHGLEDLRLHRGRAVPAAEQLGGLGGQFVGGAIHDLELHLDAKRPGLRLRELEHGELGQGSRRARVHALDSG
jgi:hypothetical protein